MKNHRLTISIPTYRRPEKLAVTLKNIGAQIRGKNVAIVVVNNDPDHMLNPYDLIQYAGQQVDVYHNRYNIGSNANILRSLEYAESDYVWLLSDDDEIAQDAVQTILADISEGSPSHVNYGLPCCGRSETVRAFGIDRYIDAIGRLNDLWLISNWVFRVDALRNGMRHAWNLSSSCAPHIVLALEMVRKPTASAVLSHRAILKGHQAQDEFSGWSILNFCLRRGVVLTVELSGKQRRRLRLKILSMFPFLDHCALALALRAIRKNDITEATELYRYIYETNVRGAASPKLWLKYRTLLLLLHFPRIIRFLSVYKKGNAFVKRLESFDHDERA